MELWASGERVGADLVIVDKPDSSTRSMMLGIFRAGGYTPVSMRSRRMAANCWNGNSAAS